MQVGDLVRSSDPWWGDVGIIIEYQKGRMGEDLNVREYKVKWLTGYHSSYWAMEKGIKVISSTGQNNREDIKE